MELFNLIKLHNQNDDGVTFEDFVMVIQQVEQKADQLLEERKKVNAKLERLPIDEIVPGLYLGSLNATISANDL